MAEELLKRIPTWLLGAAAVVIVIIVLVQRFVLELPIYDGTTGTVLPAGMAPSQETTNELQSLEQRLSSLESERPVDVGLLEDRVQQLNQLPQHAAILESDIQGIAERLDHCAYAVDYLLGEILDLQMEIVSYHVETSRLTEEEARQKLSRTREEWERTRERWSNAKITAEAQEKYDMSIQEMYERSGDEFLRIRLCVQK